MAEIRVDETLDVVALAEAYRRHGRIQIGGFLMEEDARALLRELASSDRWKLTFNRGDRVIDLGPAAYAALSADERRAIANGIVEGGRERFQFCYDVIRDAPDDPSGGALGRFVRFLNSAPVLDLFRRITGLETLATIDGHASRYGHGHFLTTHDDEQPGKARRAAYVMNLSPGWRPDWGGLLQFFDGQGNVTRAFTPAWNALNLFAVPQAHSVSWVTPLARHPRHAITGWLLDPAPMPAG